MRVAAQVIEHLCGPAKRWLRVDDPLRAGSGREPGGERLRIAQRLELAMQAQCAGVERAAQLLEKEPPEEPREDPHGQEDAGSAGEPVLAVRDDAAARYHAVHVWMVKQILPPRVQNRDEADFRAQVFRIGVVSASSFNEDALTTPCRCISLIKGDYGWPRMRKEPAARRVRIGKECVRKLMAQHGIRAQQKYIATTNSNHDLPVAPDLRERSFTTTAPNEVWTSQITYLATTDGRVYLAVAIDLFSRRLVGWSIHSHMSAELVTDALRIS